MTFQKNESKFYHEIEGEFTKKYQQSDAQATKQIESKMWERREHIIKA